MHVYGCYLSLMYDMKFDLKLILLFIFIKGKRQF